MSRGQRQAPVDYAFWGRHDEWTLDESAALLLDVDPRSLSRGASSNASLTQRLAENRELIERAYRMNDLQNHTRPKVVLGWADHKGFKIPKGLLEAVERYGGPIEEFRERNRVLEAKVKSQEEEISRSQVAAKASADESKPLTVPERRIAETMIIAMAAGRYGYRPGVRGVAMDILSDVATLGLKVEDDPIRSWLDKSSKLVGSDVWPNLPKPKSARK